MINNIFEKTKNYGYQILKKPRTELQNELVNVPEPVPESILEPRPYNNMLSEKYGYIGRGNMPYFFNYQNLHFSGNGKISCVCFDIKELNFERYCVNKMDFTCNKENNTYITNFLIDGEKIWSCREDPKNITVYFENTLKCVKSTNLFVDH